VAIKGANGLKINKILDTRVGKQLMSQGISNEYHIIQINGEYIGKDKFTAALTGYLSIIHIWDLFF